MRKIGERRKEKVLFAFLQPKSILEKNDGKPSDSQKSIFKHNLISFCKNLEVNKYGENIGIFVWSDTWDSLPLNGRASAEKCKYCSTTLVMRKLLPSIFVVWNFMICPEQSAFVNTRNKIYFTSHRYIFHAQPKSKCCWDIYPLTILWYVIKVLATFLLTLYLYIQVIDMFQADFQFASSLVRKWTQTNNF